MRTIEQLVAPTHDYVVGMRRHFRMNPELSLQEHQTQARIIAELKAIGLEPKAVAGTGVVADIQGRPGGKTVAIRADIDALPIQDEVDKDYRSQNSGVCHACGHDGHTAILLGTAKVLAALGGDLPGTVRVFFEPSEEKLPGGAKSMIAAGVLDGVDAVIGAHLWSPLPFGKIAVNPGPLMALADEFHITVKGKGGHGSMPHQTVDPILIGAQLVLALRSIVGAMVDAHNPLVLTIGSFQAGRVFNIIPETSHLMGTIRAFDKGLRDEVFSRIDSLCQGICAASGAGYQLDKIYGYPPVINDPAVAATVASTVCEVLGDAGIADMEPLMGSEDFSYYQEVVPGAFFMIGAGNPVKGAAFPHHHPKFDIDEEALLVGCKVMVGTAMKLMAG